MRVPASIVVRMKNASNMMAKWYQYAISPCMPGRPEKIWAMPTASETAPPGRPATTSPTPLCSAVRFTVDMPSVWNTAQVFFQVSLLAGYGYAHLSTRWLGARRQAWAHVALLLVVLTVLPFGLARAPAPPLEASPVPWLLFTLLITVGPPFFVVSAGGPLLARWFSTTAHARASD